MNMRKFQLSGDGTTALNSRRSMDGHNVEYLIQSSLWCRQSDFVCDCLSNAGVYAAVNNLMGR